MAKSIKVHQKRRGRPATGRDPAVTVRMPPEYQTGLDKWIKEQPKPQPSRSDAIRRAIGDWLTGLGLMSGDKPKRGRAKQRGRDKSAGMASRAIDVLADQSALAEDRAKRKRRLLKGPAEFRDLQRDVPKSKRPK